MSKNNWWRGPDRYEPPIEEPEPRHRKKRGKKPFTVECRWTGPRTYCWASRAFDKWYEWHVYSRYKTEKQRDDALATLQRKGSDPHNMPNRIEYKKGN